MFVKVESSGCSVRKGMVQIRLCMYLEPDDYGYEKHHVLVPVIPEKGYKGKVDELGWPVDVDDFTKWLDSLPKVEQDNPFLNHFIQVEPTTTDKEIMDIAEAFLHEAGVKWGNDEKLDLVNISLPFQKPSVIDTTRITACETRVQSVKAITTERKI